MKVIADERRRTSDLRRLAAKRAAEERLRKEKMVSREKDATIQNQKLAIEYLIRARHLLVKRGQVLAGSLEGYRSQTRRFAGKDGQGP